MFKKFLLVFILATGIFSCFCDDTAPFWNVRDMSLLMINDASRVVVSDTLSSDTLTLVVDFDLDYVSEVSFQQLFVNSAFAQNCDNDGDEGMKDPITKMTLSATEDYNNFTAGQPLNLIVEYGGQVGFDGFVNEVANYPAVASFGFQVTEKPTNLDSVKFNLQLDFASGSSISRESGYVFWK